MKKFLGTWIGFLLVITGVVYAVVEMGVYYTDDTFVEWYKLPVLTIAIGVWGFIFGSIYIMLAPKDWVPPILHWANHWVNKEEDEKEEGDDKKNT